VYAARSNPENPLASLVVGERPEPVVPDGWVKVKISHASLNRHDLFTLRGITAHPDPIPFPIRRYDNAARPSAEMAQSESV
jgi:NADPH:quinone reductase-like Zn-dependent oxidoreductase